MAFRNGSQSPTRPRVARPSALQGCPASHRHMPPPISRRRFDFPSIGPNLAGLAQPGGRPYSIDARHPKLRNDHPSGRKHGRLVSTAAHPESAELKVDTKSLCLCHGCRRSRCTSLRHPGTEWRAPRSGICRHYNTLAPHSTCLPSLAYDVGSAACRNVPVEETRARAKRGRGAAPRNRMMETGNSERG